MMMSCLTIFTISFAVLSSLIIADDPCIFNDAKGVIDLSSIGRTDGKAAYPDRVPPTTTDYKYSYNPCRPFTEEPACKDVAACQVSMDGKYSFALGTQDTAKWNSGGSALGSTPSVSYSSGAKQLTVTLICSTDESEEFETLGEGPTNTYKFRLTHKCACWDGCKNAPPQTSTKSPGGGGGGLSGGGAFIIILLVLAFVYFVGFALYYRFRLQRTGTELIPHRTFWVALPGYAKNGVVYVYRRVSNKGDTYQSA